MSEIFKINAEIGDIIVAKNQYDFMGKPMFEVGQEWTLVEKEQNYIHVKNKENEYWIEYNIYVKVFENEE